MKIVDNSVSADDLLQQGWRRYVNGEIGPWDFQELVESCGFRGWTGQADGTVLIHCS